MLRRPTIDDISEATKYPDFSFQIFFTPGLLGEIIDSKAEAENAPEGLRTFSCASK